MSRQAENRPPVMLVMDVPGRDGLSNLLVAHWLRALGYPVRIANKRDFQAWYPVFRPAVTVLPFTHGFIEWCRSVQGETHLVLWQQELGNVGREGHFYKLGGGGPYPPTFLDGLSRAYYWGLETGSWPLDGGLLRPEQVVITGTPRLDPYLRMAHTAGPSHERGLGFCPRFTHLNCYDRTLNVIAEVEALRDPVRAELKYGKGRNIEDFLWYWLADLRLQLDLLERYDREIGGPSYIRPDPYEWEGGYRYVEKRYPRLKVGNRSELWQWLGNLACLVTAISTAGIEALVSGIPVITTVSLMGDRRLKMITNPRWTAPINLPFYWQPRTMDEAVEMVREAKSGRLPPSPRPQDFQRYLRNYYDWPRQEPSSLTTAKDLASLADQPKSGWRPGFPGTWGRMRNLARALIIETTQLADDVRNGVFRDRQRYLWFPWHFSRQIAAENVSRRLVREPVVNSLS